MFIGSTNFENAFHSAEKTFYQRLEILVQCWTRTDITELTFHREKSALTARPDGKYFLPALLVPIGGNWGTQRQA